MNDYMELIDELRELSEWAEANIYEVSIMLPDYLKSAADAIEQLVKERDELYMEVMDCTKKIGCKAIEQVKKERTELHNELCYRCGRYKEAHNGACDGCKWRNG